MKKRLSLAIFIVLLGLLCAGLYHVYSLRLQSGDVYPPYSSLRADPLGTMALHEAFEKMPGLRVRRDFSSQNKLPEGKAIAYLHVGAASWPWEHTPEDLIKEAERFAAAGGRLVILFYPETSAPSKFERAMAGKDEPEKVEKKKEKKPAKARKPQPDSPIRARWKFGFDYVALDKTEEGSYAPDLAKSVGTRGLPRVLGWHSSLVFTNLPPDWQSVYLRGTNVVMAELRRGSGAIVIGTDSYYVSNEALSVSPQPELLSWLIGASQEVVFDEAHLGTVQATGVAGLMRKYRLGWFFGAVLLLALLFVWKESSRFTPRASSGPVDPFVQGKSASSGFINLLRRNVPARDLPRVCLDQWKHAFLPRAEGGSVAGLQKHGPTPSRSVEDKAAAAEALMRHAAAGRDPVSVYSELCAVFKTRSNHTKK